MDNRARRPCCRRLPAQSKAHPHRFSGGPEGGRSSRERLEGYQSRWKPAAVLAIRVLSCRATVSSRMAQLRWPRCDRWTRVALPTAILCYNDLAAMGLLAAAHEVGWQVPADLSVVGYDNLPLSAFTVPALTTVYQPAQRMGQLAVESCLATLSGMRGLRCRPDRRGNHP